MRRLAALALVALAAGCIQDDDPATPPNADPNGPPQSLPPTNTTGPATSTPTGSPTGGTSPTTTYASSPTSQPTPGVTLSAPHQEDSAAHEDFPGLLVAGQLDVTDNVAHFEAVANNMGQRTYRVSDVCVTPWDESMLGPDGDVAHRQPKATCTAFGLRDFPPGESIPFSAEWNGTLWSTEDGSGFGPAEPGTYTWTARFQVFSGGSGASYDYSGTLELQFQVTVG